MPAPPQPMRPRGLQGRVFGLLMERLSASNYAWVVQHLEAAKPASFLEIGFGTGQLLALVARRLKPQKITGIDPSPLMVKTAEKKLRRFAKTSVVKLREGDDTLLTALAGPFDAAAALHSFQFWSAPATTLACIHALLPQQGLFVLVLRPHGEGAPTWLPNPITRSGDELAGARKALAEAGLRIAVDEPLKTGSRGIVAVRV